MHILYLHGFASGPASSKGVAVDRHFSPRGHRVERLDQRCPSLEALSFEAMCRHVRERIAAAPGEVLLFGSSLGGLTAAHVAVNEPRVHALVLLAPAFGMGPRWRAQYGHAEWEAAKARGFVTVKDYTTGKDTQVHFAFFDEIDRAVGVPEPTQPALVIHGTRDDLVPVAGSKEWVTHAPNRRRLVEVDDEHELRGSIPRILSEVDAFTETL